jgi:isopenicillin N synthase-like dioxygenase
MSNTVQIELPVIDMSRLFSPDIDARKRVAAELGKACRDTGFFYVTGHGIEQSEVEAVFEASRRFFAMDIASKRVVTVRNSKTYNGYLEPTEEALNRNDPNAPKELKEAFGVGLELSPDDPRMAEPFRGANQWPTVPGVPNFRSTLLSYFNACWSVGRTLHQGFCLDLGLDESYFEDKLDAPLAGLRFLHYPPATEPGLHNSMTGAGEHTDYGNLSLLADNGVGGLQLRRRDGKWIDAPSIPGAFVCNIGDCLMRWTDDVYVSTPHRVTIPERDRYSIAFFLDPNPTAVVIPVLGGEDALRRYPAVTGAEYAQSRLVESHKLDRQN